MFKMGPKRLPMGSSWAAHVLGDPWAGSVRLRDEPKRGEALARSTVDDPAHSIVWLGEGRADAQRQPLLQSRVGVAKRARRAP
jgi:hypothetical protein